MKPLATIDLRHARIELWPDNVRTVFRADGKDVVAAPNEGEDLVFTAVHEYLHSAVQEALSDEPSRCLRAVAEGDAKRWTPQRREEEGLAWSLTPKVVELLRALTRAYEVKA